VINTKQRLSSFKTDWVKKKIYKGGQERGKKRLTALPKPTSEAPSSVPSKHWCVNKLKINDYIGFLKHDY